MVGGGVAKGAVRPLFVVFAPPACDEDLRLRQRGEDLSVEALVAQLAIEGLDIAVLPGAARLDEEGRDADAREPGPDRMGRELGAVVGAQRGGWAALDEELGQTGEDVVGPQAAGDHDGEALARVLIDDAEQPQRPPVVGPILDEVVSPDVVGAGGPPPRGCAVRQPQATLGGSAVEGVAVEAPR